MPTLFSKTQSTSWQRGWKGWQEPEHWEERHEILFSRCETTIAHRNSRQQLVPTHYLPKTEPLKNPDVDWGGASKAPPPAGMLLVVESYFRSHFSWSVATGRFLMPQQVNP